MLATNADRAREALQTIPPDLPRDEWVKAGMAAQAAGLGFDDFNEWSAAGSNYTERDARDTWRSIKPGGGIGPGTLFRMAADHGYSLPRKKSPSKGPGRPQAPSNAPRAGVTPAEVWGRAEAATPLNPYVMKKGAAGVPLESLRVLSAGDTLRIGGHSMAGALLVPAYAPDGALQSLQCIPPDGPKMNLAGAPIGGASFTVGDMAPDVPLYLVEGIGAAWAVWQATGRAAVVCFGWGNVGKVAADMRQKGRALVLVPDVGKEAKADEIARELGCLVAKLPEGWPANSDVGDYLAANDGDALAALLESASEPDAPEPLLKPVSVADVQSNPAPPPRFIWDGYAPRGVVTLLGAHGGTGKSTIALMLAVAAAMGRPLFNVDTERCRVVFASLEDGANVVRHRLAGICGAWGIDARSLYDGLHIVDGTEHPELFAAESRGPGETTAVYSELRALVQSVGVGLVVIDNASDAFGGDEIQRRQVRAFMRSLAEVAKANDAAVILLAHVDKNTSRARKAEGGEGYSGSTAWHNSARSRLFMSRAEDGTLTLEHQKNNLGKMREPLALEWPAGGLPQAVQALSPVVQGISDRVNTKALLRLIAEFSERGEHVTTATTSRTHAAKLLAGESTYPKGIKPADVFDLLRRAERAGHLARELYRGTDRKPRECWHVTSTGRELAELPAVAATAATPRDLELAARSAAPAEPCGDCGDSAGGYGGKERAHEVPAGGRHG